MNVETKTFWALSVATGAFLLFGAVFIAGSTGRPQVPRTSTVVDPVFTNTTTVRLSARELIDREEDVSGMDCYSCHDAEKQLKLVLDSSGVVVASTNHADLVFSRMNCAGCHLESEGIELAWDDDGNIVIPAAHKGLNMRHGRFGRNNNCFSCHMEKQLNKLKTPQGVELELKESTQLCASCHGPSYREWELGIHGRTSGFWNRDMGPPVRKDCASCHDPHSPAFPRMIPAPAPRRLHSAGSDSPHSTNKTNHEQSQ